VAALLPTSSRSVASGAAGPERVVGSVANCYPTL